MNSPVVKRKAKPVKQSEKENEEVTGSTINTKSPRKQPRQSQNNALGVTRPHTSSAALIFD